MSEQENSDSQEVTFTPAYQGRTSAMDEIAKRVQARQLEELHEFNEETGELGGSIQEPEAQEEEAQAEQPEAQEEPPAPKMRQVVVQGRQFDVPEDKIIEAGIRTIQKESSADRRLRDAAEKERRAQELLERAQRLSQGDVSEEAPSQGDVQPPAPDIRSLVRDELYVRDAERALEKFKQEFPEIVSDPILSRVAAQLEDERLAKLAALNESLGDPVEAYLAHGKAIRAKFQLSTSTLEEKAEKKRSIAAVSSVGAKATPVAEKPKSISEQIEEMRLSRSRGRPVQIH